MRLAVLALGLLAFAGTAHAAPGAEKTPAPEQSFDFEATELRTDFLSPAIDVIDEVPRFHISSLIKVRGDFVAEITRSADNL